MTKTNPKSCGWLTVPPCAETVCPTALKVLREFDIKTMKEPEGWHRHYRTSRRREGGDLSKEEIWA